VLFFHRGALGDFILTWPILLGMARTMPQCRVIVIGDADKGLLAEQVLRVEHRDAEAGWPALFGDRDLPERPAKLLADARKIITFVAGEEDPWTKRTTSLAPQAEITFLPPPDREATGSHVTARMIERLEGDTLLHAGATGILNSLRSTGLMAKLHDPTGPILLHPGSGSPAKNWPGEAWLDLADRLRKDHRRVRIILGEVEQDTRNAEVAKAFDAVGDVQRPRDLQELLFLLRGAGGYVGNDTGPTHLAAIVGLPTVAVFGPTDPGVWGPLGPRVTCLHVEDGWPDGDAVMDAISVE
jgi:hypothetical protein